MMQLSQHFFSVLNQGETSNSCLLLKEKKKNTPKTNQQANKPQTQPNKSHELRLRRCEN